MNLKRDNFSSRIGFILAASGSAVGLGNLWRFPYLAASYGGGTFLIVYLALVVTFGFCLLTAEIAIGRKTGLSAIGAFTALNKKYRFIGVLSTIVPTFILPYYSVIGGWVLKYFFSFFTGQVAEAATDGYFNAFIGKSTEPILWFLLFMVFVAVIVICGVENGIEKVSRLLMPLLVVITVFLAVYVLTLPGALSGVRYYLTPNFHDFSVKTILAALGQLFFSMSLAMGIMITYGSYMKKSANLEQSVHQIEFFDTGIAFLAGLMIVPAVFAFSGGDPAALNAGPGLMFITLPKVFEALPAGRLIGIIFFLLVFFATITSAISIMEAIVSNLIDTFHWSRRKSSVVIFSYSVLMGLPCSLGFGLLDFIQPLGMSILDMWDFLCNSVLMPIVALLTCLFVGFVLGPRTLIEEACAEGAVFKSKRLFTLVIKWIAPILLIVILISSVLNSLGIFSL